MVQNKRWRYRCLPNYSWSNRLIACEKSPNNYSHPVTRCLFPAATVRVVPELSRYTADGREGAQLPPNTREGDREGARDACLLIKKNEKRERKQSAGLIATAPYLDRGEGCEAAGAKGPGEMFWHLSTSPAQTVTSFIPKTPALPHLQPIFVQTGAIRAWKTAN